MTMGALQLASFAQLDFIVRYGPLLKGTRKPVAKLRGVPVYLVQSYNEAKRRTRSSAQRIAMVVPRPLRSSAVADGRKAPPSLSPYAPAQRRFDARLCRIH